MTAVEIQQEFLAAARKSAAAQPKHALMEDLLQQWEHALECLRRDPSELRQQLDWVIKKYVLENYREKHRCGWDDPRLQMVDLQYHDIRPEKSLYYLLERQGSIERVVTDDEIHRAITQPPPDTRAYFRGKCLQRYRGNIYGVTWGAISFETGNGAVKRVLMPEPAKGTLRHVQELLEKSGTVEELLTNLVN